MSTLVTFFAVEHHSASIHQPQIVRTISLSTKAERNLERYTRCENKISYPRH